MTLEKAKELGITFDTETPTQEEIDEKVANRVAELTGENSKLHNTISKVNSENADYKRKEKEKMTEEEKTTARIKELEEKTASYEKQFAKTSKVNDYLSIGVSKELAEKIADAELEGKPTGAFWKEHAQAREEAIKKELMAQNPAPKQGEPKGKEPTLEEYNKMTYSQKLALQESNPTLFEKYSHKN